MLPVDGKRPKRGAHKTHFPLQDQREAFLLRSESAFSSLPNHGLSRVDRSKKTSSSRGFSCRPQSKKALQFWRSPCQTEPA
ncbi:hypothetical protein [Spirosoma daeguense]